MQNFETAIKASAEAEDAQGSAMKENEKYMDSIEGKLDALRSAWSRFSNEMINSDMIKNVLSGLTGVLDFLASDAGQAMIKLTALAVGVGGVAKVFKFAFGHAKTFASAIKLVRGASVVATPEVAGLATEITTLGSVLASPIALIAGLVAGVGLLAYAAKKFGSSSERNSKKAQEDYENTKKDIEKMEDEVSKKSDRINELRKKAHSDEGLTDAEQTELRYLELETEELRKQIELKQQLAANQRNDKWETVNANKLDKKSRGEVARKVQTQHMSQEQAMSSLGINNKIDASNVGFKNSVEEARKLTDAYQQASDKAEKMYNKYGENSSQYKKAVEEEITALNKKDKALGQNKDTFDVITDQTEKLKKKRDELYEDYGGKELFEKNAPKELKKSAKEMQHLIDVGANLRDIHSGEKSVTEGMLSIQKSAVEAGTSFGIVSKNGKKIDSINFNQFKNSMADAGLSADETLELLKQIKEQNPDVKITTKGGEEIKNIDEDIKSVVDKTKGEKVLKVKTKTTNSSNNNNSKNNKSSGTTNHRITGNSLQQLSNINSAAHKIPKNVKTNVKVTGGAKSKITAIKDAIKKLKDKIVTIKVKKKTVQEAHGTRNFPAFASGTGNAEVNEQGFEIIQDRETGQMRVANGGYRGLTYIGNGDAVFTHGQSMRMLAQAGLTEADITQGQTEDVFLSGIRRLRGFKGGLNKSAYNKKYNKLKEAYEDAVAKAEYEQNRYHYSDEWLANQMTSARDTYLKGLAEINASARSGFSKKTGLETETERTYQLKLSDLANENAKKDIEAQAEELKYGRKTYTELARLYKKYLDEKKISAEDYENYIKELNEKEIDRAKSNYSNQWEYMSQYIQRQIDLEEKDNDLIEAKANLLSAQTQKVKIYREGQGFVYEQDAEAVKDAEEDLKSYTSVWQQLSDYMSEVETQTNLQQAGVLAGDTLTSIVGGGLSVSSWKDLINLVGANKGAYDLASELGITDKSSVTSQPNFNNMNIENIVLPNVSNANDFYNELQLLATQAIQSASVRG